MAADRLHVLIYGLRVNDDELYSRYREAMAPILRRYGGAFVYDFVVSRVLRQPVDAPINRLFSMTFPEKDAAERFFSDAEYRKIRGELFDSAVGSVTCLAAYDGSIG